MYAYDMALKAGRKAMNNFETDYFKVGVPFNATVLKANSPLIEVSGLDKVVSTLLYSSDASSQLATISNGELVVENGVHMNYDSIKATVVATMNALGSRK
jgi:formimidoylglutamate deiminase